MNKLIAACLVLGLAGCGRPEAGAKYRQVVCDPPLRRVIVGPHELVVDPLPTMDWRSLIVLRAVRDIRAALTFDQAEKLWGPPDRRLDGVYLEYHRPGVSILVSEKRYMFPGWHFETPRTYALLQGASLPQIFHYSVLKVIADGPEDLREVIIMDPVYWRHAMKAVIEGNQVRSLIWYLPPSPASLSRPGE